MKTYLASAAAIVVSLGIAAPSAHAADLKTQPIAMVKVDVTGIADGYRASKLIGTPVRNDNKDAIGKLDDLLVSKNDRVLFAVLSVGGFLGMGDKLVVVPYNSIQVEQDGNTQILVVPGATKDALKSTARFQVRKVIAACR